MKKPQVKNIQNQKVEKEREVNGYEAEELLRKYGYSQDYSVAKNKPEKKSNNLTFEELLKQQEQKEKEKRDKKNAPKPSTFNGRNGYNSKVKWGSDDELGFGFKIEVSSDMKLPKD